MSHGDPGDLRDTSAELRGVSGGSRKFVSGVSGGLSRSAQEPCPPSLGKFMLGLRGLQSVPEGLKGVSRGFRDNSGSPRGFQKAPRNLRDGSRGSKEVQGDLKRQQLASWKFQGVSGAFQRVLGGHGDPRWPWGSVRSQGCFMGSGKTFHGV